MHCSVLVRCPSAKGFSICCTQLIQHRVNLEILRGVDLSSGHFFFAFFGQFVLHFSAKMVERLIFSLGTRKNVETGVICLRKFNTTTQVQVGQIMRSSEQLVRMTYFTYTHRDTHLVQRYLRHVRTAPGSGYMFEALQNFSASTLQAAARVMSLLMFVALKEVHRFSGRRNMDTRRSKASSSSPISHKLKKFVPTVCGRLASGDRSLILFLDLIL